MTTYTINLFWDQEAETWCVSSDDVPGLVAEADSLDVAYTKANNLIPELLELNNHPIPESYTILFAFSEQPPA